MFGRLKNLTRTFGVLIKKITEPYEKCLGVRRTDSRGCKNRRAELKRAQTAYQNALAKKGPGNRFFVVHDLVMAQTVVRAVLGDEADMNEAAFMKEAAVCRHRYFEDMSYNMKWQHLECDDDFVNFALACRMCCKRHGI
ncbi:MAG: hypothetical protein JXK94_05425 [Deltaproteobacteria bacterium]|nr:hypothetical protein [Deltaproteobacteria bacterium]